MFHEFLTFIGVNNTDFEKGERLVSNEVDSNNEIISMMKTDGLEMRKKLVILLIKICTKC